MGDNSHIEWTEATWNPVTGCTKVSEGCRNCYIVRTPPFRMAGRTWSGDGDIGSTTGVQLHLDRLDQPLRWARPRLVFVNSLSDLFHQDVPDEFIAEVFAVMAMSPQHTFQILTKRPARMRALLASFELVVIDAMLRRGADVFAPIPLSNVWLGVSVEDQAAADQRIPQLLETPAAVRFLSCEPLLGPVDLETHLRNRVTASGIEGVPGIDRFHVEPPGIHWVIVGGESGPDARPMHPTWARSLRAQCEPAGVAFFFKQWGEWAPVAGPNRESDLIACVSGYSYPLTQPHHHPCTPGVPDSGGTPSEAVMRRVGKKAAGRELDGRTWDDMPKAVITT